MLLVKLFEETVNFVCV